jgi:bifunctional oligoribonuclease and PAP phosphatase NrnA
VLGSGKSSADESIARIALPDDQLEKYEVDSEAAHGFINHLLLLDTVKGACMFRQNGANEKMGFRSTDVSVDLGVIAQAPAGGGHDHSAGTVQEGHLHDVIPATMAKKSADVGLILQIAPGHTDNRCKVRGFAFQRL